MAMVGYPNEAAVFQYLDISRSNIGMNNGGSPANYVTFANFTLIGGSACFGDGGFYTNPNSGGIGIRLIGNVMSAAYGNANTMTGMILIQNNYWKVLGNEMKDTVRQRRSGELPSPERQSGDQRRGRQCRGGGHHGSRRGEPAAGRGYDVGGMSSKVLA